MRKRLAVVVLFAVMILMFAVPVSAYTQRTVALASESGKWITQKAETYSSSTDTYTEYVYKVVVPSTGHLRINVYNGDEYDYVCITKKKNADTTNGFYYNGGRYGVDKGTYYLHTYEGTKFKYTFTAAPAGTNFARARAVSLAKSTRKQIAQTPKYNYSRWYIAKITARQRINITVNGEMRARLVNSKGVSIPMSSVDTSTGYRLTSKKVLDIGTYYSIALRSNEEYADDEETYLGYYLGGDISWK